MSAIGVGHAPGCDFPIPHAACCASSVGHVHAVQVAVQPAAAQVPVPPAAPVVPLAAAPVVPLVAALAAAPPVAAPPAAAMAPPAAPAAAPPVAGVVPNGAALLAMQGTEQANLLARQQQELNDLTVQQHAAQVRLLEAQRAAQLIGLGPQNTACTDARLVQLVAQQGALRTLADNNANIEAGLVGQLETERLEVSRAQTALGDGKRAGLGEDVIGLLELALENHQRMEGLLCTSLGRAMDKFRLEQLGLLQQNHAEQVALIEAQWREKRASLGLVLP